MPAVKDPGAPDFTAPTTKAFISHLASNKCFNVCTRMMHEIMLEVT